MKLALLTAVAFAAGVALLTAPVQSFLYDTKEFVLDVMRNDRMWVRHLDVGIKIEVNKLSAAARDVLLELGALDDQPPPGTSDSPAVVVRALHIVAEVASAFSGMGIALEFSLSAIASAIKCNTLGYVLIQLHAIEQMVKVHNEIITQQSTQVWATLIQILDKLTLLKESVEVEFKLYQQWKSVVDHDMTKVLPTDFHDFKSLVVNTLHASCELCEFEKIKDGMKLDPEVENLDTHDGAMKVFSKCQKLLKDMFNDLPITTMKLEIWENLLNNPKLAETSVPNTD